MFEITVISSFSSAHHLRQYKGKCEKLHGHNWKVEITVCGNLDEKSGMVIDFGILKQELKKVLSELDHAYLNDIDYFKKVNPSSENIAVYICERMKILLARYNVSIKKVSIWENENQFATYYPPE